EWGERHREPVFRFFLLLLRNGLRGRSPHQPKVFVHLPACCSFLLATFESPYVGSYNLSENRRVICRGEPARNACEERRRQSRWPSRGKRCECGWHHSVCHRTR